MKFRIPFLLLVILFIAGCENSRIKFPAWLTRETSVYMYINSEENSLHFKNAETLETFELPLEDFSRKYFWMPDGNSFGYFSATEDRFFVIEISSGKIEAFPIVPEMTTQILEAGYVYGGLHVFETSSDSIRFIASYYDYFYTPDGKWQFQWLPEDKTRAGLIIEVQTQIIKQLPPHDAELYDVDFAWSPVGEKLAILQSKFPPNGFTYTRGKWLQIFDPNTGEVVNTYYGDFGDIDWSPDGTKILFNGVNKPCILNLASGEMTCMLIQTRLSQEYYRWSPDGKKIGYVRKENSIWSFCFIDLDALWVHCPSKKFEELSARDIGYFTWSPDSNYVEIYDDTVGQAFSDVISDPKQGILAIDGSAFYRKEFEIIHHDKQLGCQNNNAYYLNQPGCKDEEGYYPILWRPVLSP